VKHIIHRKIKQYMQYIYTEVME